MDNLGEFRFKKKFKAEDGTSGSGNNKFGKDGSDLIINVPKGTVIKNSILMQDTTIGSNCNIDHVITDKNVAIRDRNNLMGCEKVPYYLGKYATV